MSYLTVECGAGLNMLKNKGGQILDSIKMMRTGDLTRVKKKDLSCFYAVAKRHNMVFRRQKDGDEYMMIMVRNGYAENISNTAEKWRKINMQQDNM